jgi:glucosylceramidase
LRRIPLAIALTFALVPVSMVEGAQAPTKHATEGATKVSATNVSATTVEVYISSEETKPGPIEQPSIQFGVRRAPELTISVNPTVRYQLIDGFGASLTESSAWLLSTKLTESQRNDLLQKLFDPQKGIGLSLLRQPMGASDFALESYTYDDVPSGESDPALKNFSVQHDERYIIPLLRQALTFNPGMKIFASPWSPPAWMKSSQSVLQGSLLPTSHQPLANYFVQYIQAYEKAGVPIFAVTMQNEPLHIPLDYPGMGMSAAEQAAFLRDALGPAFRRANLKTKILIFDHNWDLIHFAIEILEDPKAATYVSGIATHCYGGNPAAQEELHNRFPNLAIWMTECSGGGWQNGNLLVEQTRLIIESTRHWSRGVVLWNLALDQDHKPYLGGCNKCRGVVTINDNGSSAEVEPTVDFTALAHASKFVRPGARRIESNTFGESSLEDVAFQNPDGSVVLLVLNSARKPITFNIAWAGKYAVYTLNGNSVATFIWKTARKR